MGIFKVIRNTNDELQYLYNVLNYTMGIHTDYDKRYSPNVDIYNAYEQFLSVKKYFGKTSGNPAFHFIVVYDARSTWGDNYERAESMSRSIASYFSDKSFCYELGQLYGRSNVLREQIRDICFSKLYQTSYRR